MYFEFVYPYSVDVVEAAPPGAAEDHWSCWDMQGSAHLVNTTVVKHFFYNALALNALPVHLLRQVYVLVFFGVFFSLRFLLVFLRCWRGLWGLWGRFWSHLGSIWKSFLSLFWGKGDL